MLAYIFKQMDLFKKLSFFCGIFFYVLSAFGSGTPKTKSITFDMNKFSIFSDFLYWHASEETSSLWAYDPFPPTIRSPNTYFNWSPGVRTGIDYMFNNQLDTKFYWTYFSTKTQANQAAENGEYLFPQFFNGFTSSSYHLTPYNSAHLDWNLSMNMFDFEIGHQFQWLNYFKTRPFFGVKGGYINQNIQSNWSFSGLDILQLINISWKSTENVMNNFSGVGPSFGLDNQWNIYKNLSFRGDISGAFLWGYWRFKDIFSGKVKVKEDWSNTDIYNSPTATNVSSLSNNLGSFMLRYFAGLDWTYESQITYTVKIGYEMQFWMNQLRIPMLQEVPVHGDLTLQGMTCGLLIKF
jgi:hypothetical protein